MDQEAEEEGWKMVDGELGRLVRWRVRQVG
jgi:hypothetical protein